MTFLTHNLGLNGYIQLSFMSNMTLSSGLKELEQFTARAGRQTAEVKSSHPYHVLF